jgi:hypothetical protein
MFVLSSNLETRGFTSSSTTNPGGEVSLPQTNGKAGTTHDLAFV